MLTVREIDAALETRLAADLGRIHRRLAEAWRELVEASGGSPTAADRERLTTLARRLFGAYAVSNGPRIVAAQEFAVMTAVATAKPDAADVWRAATPAETGRYVGVVRGGDPVGRWLAGVGNVGVEVIAELLLGELGLPADLFAEALGEVGSRYLMGSRTAVHDAGRSATLATYRANDDMVTGWRWVATLDDATCLACVSQHGQIFALDDDFQESHIGCRCSSSPEVTGQTPIGQTGDDWLAEQISRGNLANIPTSAHDDIRNGRLELRDFVTRGTDIRYGADYREASVRVARERAVSEGRLIRSADSPTGYAAPVIGDDE